MKPQGRIKLAVEIDSYTGCWLWQKYVRPDGYGRIRVGRRMVLAHRFSYESFVGPIPEGLVLDHICRVRHCINPVHLEPVSHTKNVQRGVSPAAANGRKTSCVHGHLFNEANTYLRKVKNHIRRECRTCKREGVIS